MAERCGPVVVCLDTQHNAAMLAQCGTALALAWDVPLYLAAVVVVPPQRPLQDLIPEEQDAANALLDAATELVPDRRIDPVEEVWVVRKWDEAIAQMAEELAASAVVIGWHGAGPFGLFDIGRTLRKSVACPVIMVNGGMYPRRSASWPPQWLAEAQLRLSD